MAAKQNIMHTISQATTNTAKAALIAVREGDSPVNTARPVEVMPITGHSTIKIAKI